MGVAGYELELADGNLWRIPLIRRWDMQKLEHVPSLPSAITSGVVDGKRCFVTKVRGQYAALDAKCDGIFACFLEKKTTSIDQLMTDAAELLAVNYRLGVEEVDLLGLLTPELALKLLGMAIDTPRLTICGEEIENAGLIPRQTPTPIDPSDEPMIENDGEPVSTGMPEAING